MHIDHLVISQFGIFVIETVSRGGKISGAEFQERWKQYQFGHFKHFDNPLHQNYQSIKALTQLLQAPDSIFHSIVVFSGSGSFTHSVPANVIPMEKLIPLIRKRNKKLLQPEEANRLLKQLEEARIGSHKRGLFDRWKVLRLILFVILLAGSWLAFQGELLRHYNQLKEQIERNSAPELFHADGRRKSEQEVWEASLRCAYSVDSGRCACYEPSGSKVDLGIKKCQSLSEQGSVLKQ